MANAWYTKRIPFDELAVRFNAKLFDPKTLINVVYIRVILYGFFAWKLLSRDYRIFSFADEKLLNAYAYKTFAPSGNYIFLGRPVVVDLATFHWVHWILPFPNYAVMSVIYFGAITLCFANLIFGSGPKNLLSIFCFVTLNYLWGYNWRTGADVDAIFIPLQMCLLFAIYPGVNPPIWQIGGKSQIFKNDAGWLYSMCLLIIIGYYVLSGFNKIVDIQIFDWFTYPLVEQLEHFKYYSMAAGPRLVNPIPLYLVEGMYWVNPFAVSLIYFSHITIPLMFFYRSMILKFLAVYWAFHFASSGLSIWFSGLLLIWLVLLPVHRLFVPVTLSIDGSPSLMRRIKGMVSRLDTWKRVTVEVKGDGRVISMTCAEDAGPGLFQDGLCLRRLCWTLPAFWPLLPVMYVPFLPQTLFWLLRKASKG